MKILKIYAHLPYSNLKTQLIRELSLSVGIHYHFFSYHILHRYLDSPFPNLFLAYAECLRVRAFLYLILRLLLLLVLNYLL